MELLEIIVKYWQILGAIVLAVTVWTKHTVEVGELKRDQQDIKIDVSKLADRISNIDLTYIGLQKDIIEIKTSLKYIEQKLDTNSHKLGLS